MTLPHFSPAIAGKTHCSPCHARGSRAVVQRLGVLAVPARYGAGGGRRCRRGARVAVADVDASGCWPACRRRRHRREQHDQPDRDQRRDDERGERAPQPRAPGERRAGGAVLAGRRQRWGRVRRWPPCGAGRRGASSSGSTRGVVPRRRRLSLRTKPVGDDFEQREDGGVVEVGLVGHRRDAADEPDDLQGLDVVAQRVLARGALDDHRSLAPREDLALGADRGVGVAHGGGDLGRAALVHADQPDVLLEPAEQQVARRALEGERLLDGLVDAVDPALHDRVEQRVAVGEVPVERAGADARALGDLVEGGVVALLAEDRSSGLHEAVVVALRVSAHLHSFQNHLAKRRLSPYRSGGSGATLRIKSTSAHSARTGPLSMTSTLSQPDRATTRPVDLPDNAGRAAMGIAIVLTAQLMFTLDATVVNVALPTDRHRPRLRPGLALVGAQRLHARLRRAAAARRPARRRLRTAPAVPRRRHRLHPRLAPRRPGPDPRVARRRPRRSRASARRWPRPAYSRCSPPALPTSRPGCGRSRSSAPSRPSGLSIGLLLGGVVTDLGSWRWTHVHQRADRAGDPGPDPPLRRRDPAPARPVRLRRRAQPPPAVRSRSSGR